MKKIDIDFEDSRRHEVIEYVRNKYGMNYAAMIGTTGTLSEKAVSRAVGRVFDFTQDELSVVSDFLTGPTLRDSWENRSQEFHDFVMNNEQHKTWLRTASQLEGLPRNLSTHAAGVILSPIPIVEVAPLTKGSNDMYTTQWTMSELEAVGLLKMDFLGLRNLTLLQEIYAFIGHSIPFEDMDLTDEPTLDLFRRGETFGIFQFESPGMRNALSLVRPDSFEDLVAVSALYRPGPMQYIPEYAQRKQGQSPIHYPHESTVSILEETYGIMVYQEQIMQVASVVAGYSYGEADLLRRAVSKKNRNVLENERKRFVERSIENDVSGQVAEIVYADIVKFADYGFPKSHAVAYTIISFQLAYLKANHPHAFYAALLNHSKPDSKIIIDEMKRLNINFITPDVMKSAGRSIPSENSVILGMDLIKGVPKQAKEIIEKQEHIATIFELAFLLGTTHFNERVVESLIKSNALRQFGNQRTLLTSYKDAERFLQFNSELTYQEAVMLGQPRQDVLEEYDERTLLNHEFETFGFYLSGHPAEHVKQDMDFKGANIAYCLQAKSKEQVTIIGSVERLRRIKTKKKDSMAFITLEDETGEISCTLFPKQFEQYRSLITEHAILRLTGVVEWRNKEPQIIINHIQRGMMNS